MVIRLRLGSVCIKPVTVPKNSPLTHEIGQEVSDLLFFLGIESKNLRFCHSVVHGDIPQDSLRLFGVDLFTRFDVYAPPMRVLDVFCK